MKIFGRKIQGPNIEYIVIPRVDGDIVLKAEAVLSMKDFEEKVPLPKPPTVVLPGGATKADLSDPAYTSAIQQRNRIRYGYILTQSLKPTEGLEWETIQEDKPETLVNWEQELKDSGFSNPEINMIMEGVAAANGINQEKLDEARKRFLASLTPHNA